MSTHYCFLAGLKQKARRLYDQGEYEAALFFYSRVIEQSPTDYWAWIGKALTYADMKSPWKAIHCNEHAIAIEPEHPAAWNNNAICKWEVGYRKAAIRCYKRAVELQIKHKSATSMCFQNLIHTYQDLNQPTDALLVADTWIRAFPDSQEARGMRTQFLLEVEIPKLKLLFCRQSSG